MLRTGLLPVFACTVLLQAAGLTLYRAFVTVGTEEQGALGIPIKKASKSPPGAPCGRERRSWAGAQDGEGVGWRIQL